MAFWLRMPLLQCTTISRSGSSSPKRCASAGSGISVLPAMRQIWYSSGLRTSRMKTSSLAVEPLLQLLDGDFAGSRGGRRRRFLAAHAAELLVVDQLP